MVDIVKTVGLMFAGAAKGRTQRCSTVKCSLRHNPKRNCRLTEMVRLRRGLAWVRINPNGIASSFTKFLNENE